MIIEVKEEDSLLRLDYFLSIRTSFSRSRVKKIILDGGVWLREEVITDSSRKVKLGENYRIEIPEIEPLELVPLNKSLDIVYEDEDLIVINKPANLTVHPGAGNYQDTLVNILLYHSEDSLSGIGGVSRPGIVHRLDKDTSGVMVVAKNDETHISLSNQIQSRELKRIYSALIWRNIYPSEGRIEANIGRSRIDRKKMGVVREGGKEAVTHYKLVRYFGKIGSLVECRLETGRTHQIRVHLSNLGYPIIGDQTYGRSKSGLLLNGSKEERDYITKFPRQALHSRFIEFYHPRKKERLSFKTELPEDISKLIEALDKVSND